MEAPPGIGPGMKVLQTSALPLGYGAGGEKVTGDADYGATEPRRRITEQSSLLCRGDALGFLTAPRREIGVRPESGSKKSGKDHGILPALFWSGLRGSNPPPRPWQGRALPNELNPRSDLRSLVPPVGIEPTTRGFSVLCSTN